jgi:cytochrome P450
MQMIEDHVAIAPPVGVPSWDVDPYDEGLLRQPEDYYAELRARGPFVYLSRYAMLACGRYAETQTVFSDSKRFVSSRGVGLADFKHVKPWRPPSIVLEVDPPAHARTRNVIARALSPAAVSALRDQFLRAAEQLLDQLLEQRSVDGVRDLAEVFPSTAFPQAVGLREFDRRRLLGYGAMVFNALGPDNALRRSAMAQATDIVPWITAHCRREQLRPDGMGAAIYQAVDAGELSEDEAGMLVRSLLSAGIDTTVTGIGNALWCLATNPEEFERLRADPALARSAFQEVLRYTSPVHSFCRTSVADTEVSGIAVPENAKILCVLGAANLDERNWPDAARFDITRRSVGHLAFGVGVHACVGQVLARAEVEAVLTALARRVTRIELDAPAEWRPGNSIRSLERLPLRISAA